MAFSFYTHKQTLLSLDITPTRTHYALGVLSGDECVVHKTGTKNHSKDIFGDVVLFRRFIQGLITETGGPKNIFLSLHSSLCHDVIQKHAYTRSNPYEQMTQKELENTLYKLGKEAAANTHAVRSWEWAEMCSALVSTSIDDMSVRNPIGFRGNMVKMTLWNSFVPRPMLEMIYESIEELDRKLVAVYPSHLALLEMMNNEAGSLCCIIIEYESMTIIVREGTTPQWIQNIPLGCSGFFQKCMEVFHTNPDTTRTLLSAWAQWQLQKDDADKIQTLFDQEGAILLLALDVAFQWYEGTLPSRFVLWGMSGYIHNLTGRLQERHWEKRYSFSQLPTFEIAPQWDAATIEQAAALGGVIVSFQPQKKGTLGRILDRVSRLLSF